MIDFNSKSLISDRINFHIDKALELEQTLQPGRDYLGGSRIGAECERALQYEFLKVPKENSLDGRILRVFARGHWVESAMIDWLKMAGFGLVAELKDGGQFEFTSHDGKIKGHCDGVFVSGPSEFGPWPRLWECKGLEQKYFKALIRNKLKKEFPTYYGQCQFYMKKFNLTENPALFSAVNMNRMEIYWESIPFDENYYLGLDYKATRIIQACEAGELLPKVPKTFKCKFCSYQNRCVGNNR